MNLLLGVEPRSELSINDFETINFKTICNKKSIVKMIIEVENQDEFTVSSLDKNITFCGLIVGDMKDKLPCFILELVENRVKSNLLLNIDYIM